MCLCVCLQDKTQNGSKQLNKQTNKQTHTNKQNKQQQTPQEEYCHMYTHTGIRTQTYTCMKKKNAHGILINTFLCLFGKKIIQYFFYTLCTYLVCACVCTHHCMYICASLNMFLSLWHQTHTHTYTHTPTRTYTYMLPSLSCQLIRTQPHKDNTHTAAYTEHPHVCVGFE